MEEIIKIVAVVVATAIGFTIAGVAGFGGGVVALPVLVWVFGVREAIPILSISQVLSTVSRVGLHRDALNWPVIRYFALGALPFSVLGSLFFITIDTTVLVRILGVMMLLFVVYTRMPIGRNFKMKLWGFIPLGAGTGFGSAFLGIPGPFAAVFYLAYGLTASAYIGTSSLGMAMIQVPKLIIFGAGDLLTLRVLLLGIGLGAIAAACAYLGRIILRRVPEKVFPRIITVMLLVSGVVFLIRG
ncbi:MAG: sulfite exporter TauE/SafE family protein [Chloroflexi bacterium]|nr:sulfite exporter TauE/SafE family protein [Chloroflexota bacterium]MCI0801216.1 sulfite exporter TauE/SafE family protein [Chloroflexota bacterium]MCI0847603.1 sulfite exporter TauE/SafE family protein [Chloroflexota bacterium]MCI0864023.1 sulfite exporter TauE/SafE family protein [Chloroflexota bacterium]MCI0897507.1 sulfite exporter TauE/SafE family protein [Chloroflexota bacterium]